MTRLPDLDSLRGAWWALRALRTTRRALSRGEIRRIAVPNPPPTPAGTIGAVDAVLQRMQSTCLERALVRQRWLAAHGEPRAVAIGVTPPSQGFLAHAWLVGEDDPLADRFHEFTRLDP
ncbi:MAG: lasso peptide biosynthesis B2 protein [Sciscionella sp.]